jgi:hypothetical protein
VLNPENTVQKAADIARTDTGSKPVSSVDEVKSLINRQTGAFDRGGDYIRSVLKKASDNDLIDFIRWSRSPESTPYVARFGGDYAADILRQRNVPVDEIEWQIKNIKEPVSDTGAPPVSPATELFKPSETPFNLAGEALTSEPSAEGAARAAAESEFQQKKEQELFGFGPGAAASGEIKLRAGSELRQLSEAVADSLKAQGPKAGATQRVNAAATAAAKVSKGVTPVQRRANTVKAMWQALRSFYVNPTTPSLLRPGSGTGTDFIKALKDWQGADQRASFEVRQWIHEMRKGLDPMTDEGITNYIEADGDPALLQQRANAGGKYGPGYEAALKLTPEQINIAENMKQYFAAMLQDGINLGMLDHGIENYITHLVKQPNKVTNALMADLQSGKLQKNFKYALKRVFDTHFDLEQAGYEPVTKRASELLSAYDLSFRRALNARVFIKALRDAKAADGEPVTRFSGMTQQVPRGDVPAEAYLIRSRALPKNAIAADGSAYKVIDHPALRGWKFVVQEGAELPAYHQADMLVHPDHFDHLKNVLAISKLRTGPLGAVVQPFLKVGALAKQTRLSLSIFHLDQEGLHGLFHRVNPANLEQINFDDPKQWALVRNGLQVADYSAMELFSEGLRGGGLVAKIPGLGELQNRFNEFLFKDYIPRLKITMALHAFDRNVKRYPNLSPEVIAEMTARQGNAAFGELNYKLMGRSPTVQDFLRLTMLAPDFLEARSKFVGQALKPYGGEQRSALLLGGAVLYVTARVLNKWLDNDPHFEPSKVFSVIYNGREYRLRTVMGDVAALITDPRRFFYNRFSPWLKTGVTLGTQRDYRGIKLNGIEQVKDALSWFVPIPLGQGNEADSIRTYIQQTPQRIMSSGGLENKPAETPIDQTYKAALRFKETLKDPKIQAEVRRAQQETYAQGDYARLNRALLENDKERAVTEIVALMKDKGKTPVDLARYYDGLPSSPFTGSLQLDMRWRSVMSQPEHDLYGKAIAERIGMARQFFQLYRIAAEQYRKELK